MILGIAEQAPVRPRAVAVFEGLYLLTLLIGVAESVSGWRQATAIASPAFVVTVQVVAFVVVLALVLLIARGRRNWARWVLVVLFVLGIPALAKVVMSGTLIGSVPVSIVQSVLQLVALGLLFTPPARAWFGKSTSNAA